jgi:hypothetical protein
VDGEVDVALELPLYGEGAKCRQMGWMLTQFHQISYCSHHEKSNTNRLRDLDEFAAISY